jgi:putative PIG3 family NAD(P)H quinone oxidoreductase
MTSNDAQMTVIEITRPGGPEVLRAARRPIPRPEGDELLVRVGAAGVNRVDAFQRAGIYTPPPGTTDIPGVELAGVVEARGPDARRYATGDRVCGIVRGGGYAEYCVVPEGQALPVPAGFDDVHAAGIAETFFTVWGALYGQGRFKPGESLLVHGGSSGIGTTAIMLARALGGGDIFTTAGSDEKCRVCERIGATRAINYRITDFVEVVREATSGRGVDVVLDMVAGSYVPRNLSLLPDDGRLVLVGRMSQELEVPVSVLAVMYRRLVLTGFSLRGQSVARKTAIAREVEAHAWPLLAGGRIAPIIDSVFPMSQADKAHQLLESSRHIGKIILRMDT